ncbi:MAG: CDP-alcohol phosphatidyltransferase family protein [Bacilli bacterium]|nr:CDP-alcohol phosphatidyltransferase family protein [Bacilli bacterium]
MEKERNWFVKNIPNFITGIRIVGSFFLFFLPVFSLPYYLVYGFAGFTDALDGFIARKFKLTSKIGTLLDSIADLIFYVAMAFSIFPTLMKVFTPLHWTLVLIPTVIHLNGYIVCAWKYKRFSALHTYANKLMSFLIFAYPFAFINNVELAYSLYLYIGSGFAIYSAVETNLIHFISHRYDVRNKSIFLVRHNEQLPLEEEA